MKIITLSLFVLIIAFFIVFDKASDYLLLGYEDYPLIPLPAETRIYTPSNSNYVKFHGLDLGMVSSGDLVDPGARRVPICCSDDWQKAEIDKWVDSIKVAVSLLPEILFRQIAEANRLFKEGKKIDIYFYIDNRTWETAYGDRDGSVGINLAPSIVRPEWMTWEPLLYNGFSAEERIFVVLHEIFHVYDFSLGILGEHFSPRLGNLGFRDFSEIEKELIRKNFPVYYFDISPVWILHAVESIERPPTLYAVEKGSTEDFAESGALYVMWPEYLKRGNILIRYRVMQNLLGREYYSVYEMPESVKSRLNRQVF